MSVFSRSFRLERERPSLLCVAIYGHKLDNKTERRVDGDVLLSLRDAAAFQV